MNRQLLAMRTLQGDVGLGDIIHKPAAMRSVTLSVWISLTT